MMSELCPNLGKTTMQHKTLLLHNDVVKPNCNKYGCCFIASFRTRQHSLGYHNRQGWQVLL